MIITNQISEGEGALGFTISQVEVDPHLNIEYLISKDFFDIDIRPKSIHESLHTGDKHGYLRGLFKSNSLIFDDFKYINADGIYYYLEGFSESEEEWGDDQPLFKNLLRKFKNRSESNLDGCYLINKEWFKKESDKVRDLEFTLYDYYFIIIWVDKNDKSKLFVSEWFSD
jgi:hypothetical protein